MGKEESLTDEDQEKVFRLVLSKLVNASTELESAARNHKDLLESSKRWDDYLRIITDGIDEMAREVKAQGDERRALLIDQREERKQYLEQIRGRKQVPVSMAIAMIGLLGIALLVVLLANTRQTLEVSPNKLRIEARTVEIAPPATTATPTFTAAHEQN